MRVIELIPGMRVIDPGKGVSHTYVAQCPHPLYTRLQLVIWRMYDGEWSHDALSPGQDVGLVEPFAGDDLERNLREAFGG